MSRIHRFFIQFLPDKQLRAIVTEIEMMSRYEWSEQELTDYINQVLKYAKMLMIKEKQAEQKDAERNNDFKKACKLQWKSLNFANRCKSY